MPGDVSIVVDDREARGNILDMLHAVEGVSVRVQRLVVGDFEVDGRLLVERKRLPDLAESIKDGRLFRQTSRLVEAPLKSLVILEGTSDCLRASGMRRDRVGPQRARLHLKAFGSVEAVFSASEEALRSVEGAGLVNIHPQRYTEHSLSYPMAIIHWKILRDLYLRKLMDSK